MSLNYFRNVARQVVAPGEKIFFIGFNKCGTTAIHLFLKSQGVRSVHHKVRDVNLAREIDQRASDPDQLKGLLRKWTAYSDLIYASKERIIEANQHFRLFAELFPSAFFILNDRDPAKWVASRCLHHGGRFLKQSMEYHGLTEQGVRDYWLRQRQSHIEEVTAHFAGHERFMRFEIDRQPVSALTRFLAPAYALDSEKWRTVNRTKGNSHAA